MEKFTFLNDFSLTRCHYIASWYAAKMMVPAKQGLMINVSSPGGLNYLFNVAYGVGKAAVRFVLFVASLIVKYFLITVG